MVQLVHRGSGKSTHHRPNMPVPGAGNLPRGVKSASDFDQYRVTTDDWEGIRNALYDTVVYPAAGTGQLTLFSQQLGQGTSWSGTGSKNYSDTNMQLAGQLPADQRFLVESIELHFFPCLPQVAGFLPADYGAGAVLSWINDEWVFRTSGNLEFKVASKPYLNESPLMVFPAKTNFKVSGALSDTTTAAGNQANRFGYANSEGRPYILHPYAVGLDWGEAFTVTLNWPEGVQATPSTKPGIVRCRLDGILQRKAQ